MRRRKPQGNDVGVLKEAAKRAAAMGVPCIVQVRHDKWCPKLLAGAAAFGVACECEPEAVLVEIGDEPAE